MRDKITIKAIVAAAIYDFAGHLTCRDKPLTMGKNHDCAPAAAAVDEFLKLRNAEVVEPPIKTWERDASFLELDLEAQAQARLTRPKTFDMALRKIINEHGIDSDAGIPDFVLATMVSDMLSIVGRAHRDALTLADPKLPLKGCHDDMKDVTVSIKDMAALRRNDNDCKKDSGTVSMSPSLSKRLFLDIGRPLLEEERQLLKQGFSRIKKA